MLTSRTLGIVASVLLVTAVSAAYYSHALPVYNISSLNTPEACDKQQGYSMIIQDGNGFNGSSAHGSPSNPWPKIEVHKGDIVNLIVCNMDKVQAHGFAINHYFDRGIALGPGQVYRLSFTAKDAGHFVIYCVVFCSAHNFMVAQLVVS
jgi:nitrous oxide reductase